MIDGDDNQYDNNDNNYDDNDNNDGDDDFNDIDLHLQNRGRLGDGRSDESSGESPLVRSSSSSPSPSSSWSSSSLSSTFRNPSQCNKQTNQTYKGLLKPVCA